jgi:Tol biopolymer transport system component
VTALRRSGLVVSTGIAVLLVVGTAAGAPARSLTISSKLDEPTWSPDGKTIAAVVRTTVSDGEASVTVASLIAIDIRSRAVRRLATLDSERVAWPDWSPDGRRLVFGGGRLYVVGADGRGLREIGGTSACCASWGPGGRKIAYSTTPETQAEIRIVDADGRHDEVVASPPEGYSYWAPTWSPDGERLAFLADEAPDQAEHPPTYLGVIGSYRGKVRRLVSTRYPAAPEWSPKGGKIAFDGVRVLDLATKRVTTLHEGADPTWSPDERQLAFVYEDQLWVMRADGTNARQLTRGG